MIFTFYAPHILKRKVCQHFIKIQHNASRPAPVTRQHF